MFEYFQAFYWNVLVVYAHRNRPVDRMGTVGLGSKAASRVLWLPWTSELGAPAVSEVTGTGPLLIYIMCAKGRE